METERLVLLPGENARDNTAFLQMLRADGDFRSERRQGACMVIETDTPVDEATRQRIVNNVDGIKEACAL